MPIGNAIQKDSIVYVYDEAGNQLTRINIGDGPQNTLVGYTSSSVTIKRGKILYIYNEKGEQTGVFSS